MRLKIVFMIIVFLWVGLSPAHARTKPYYGLFGSIHSTHDYSVFFSDRKETANREGTLFSENDFSFSLLLEDNTEINAVFRKFRAQNVFIEGGLWDSSKYLVGLSIGKALSLRLGISDGELFTYEFPIDFAIGPYVFASIRNRNTFLGGSLNPDVITSKIRFSYGIYTTIRLRLKFLMDKYRFPIITVGMKYYIPFNDFEYSIDSHASYRLRRKIFFIGFYL